MYHPHNIHLSLYCTALYVITVLSIVRLLIYTLYWNALQYTGLHTGPTHCVQCHHIILAAIILTFTIISIPFNRPTLSFIMTRYTGHAHFPAVNTITIRIFFIPVSRQNDSLEGLSSKILPTHNDYPRRYCSGTALLLSSKISPMSLQEVRIIRHVYSMHRKLSLTISSFTISSHYHDQSKLCFWDLFHS